MAKRKLTFERQSVDSIEKERQHDAAGRFKRGAKSFLSFGFLRNCGLSLTGGIKRSSISKSNGLRGPNIKFLNKVFLCISIILLCYSIIEFVFDHPDIEKIYSKMRPVKEKIKGMVIPQTYSFLYYLEMVRRRNIFSPIVLKKAPNPEVKKKQLQKMTKNLSLVGISWGKEPVAMIKDKKISKTYFLKAGDIINNMKIEAVLKDRVILSHEGQKMELM